MGIAYLGIGTGGALVPLIAATLEKNFGWHNSLAILGVFVVLIAFPMVFFIKGASAKVNPVSKTEPAVHIKAFLQTKTFTSLGSGACVQ